MKKYKVVNAYYKEARYGQNDQYNALTKGKSWHEKFKGLFMRIDFHEIDDNGNRVGDILHVNAACSNTNLLLFFENYLENPRSLIGKIFTADLFKTTHGTAYSFDPSKATFLSKLEESNEPKLRPEKKSGSVLLNKKFIVKNYLASRKEKTQTFSIDPSLRRDLEKMGVESGNLVTFLTADGTLITMEVTRDIDSFYAGVRNMLLEIFPEKYKITEYLGGAKEHKKMITCLALFRGTKVYDEEVKNILNR